MSSWRSKYLTWGRGLDMAVDVAVIVAFLALMWGLIELAGWLI